MVVHEIRSEYVAALCCMKNGELDHDHSERFIATDEAEAKRKANQWAVGMLISESSWLRVTLNGVGIFTREIRLSNAHWA